MVALELTQHGWRPDRTIRLTATDEWLGGLRERPVIKPSNHPCSHPSVYVSLSHDPLVEMSFTARHFLVSLHNACNPIMKIYDLYQSAMISPLYYHPDSRWQFIWMTPHYFSWLTRFASR
jgi:hypothetical protein